MIHPEQQLHDQLTHVFNGCFTRERLDAMFENVETKRDEWLEEQVVQATDQIIHTPVVIGGYEIVQPWLGTAVVAVMDEVGKLMMVQSILGDYTRYHNPNDKEDRHFYKRPAIAKAAARRLLDINELPGGIEQHWKWLKDDCGYAWHAGDATALLPDGRRAWIGVTAAEPTMEYRLAVLGYPNASHAIIDMIANDPRSIYMQAGLFDTFVAEYIAGALSGGTMIGVSKSILAEANN